jgi:hypothetical protein
MRDNVHDTDMWIDALSISQSDTAEKANHINMIGKIFQQATHVLAWVVFPDSSQSQISLSQLDKSVDWSSHSGDIPRRNVFRKVGGFVLHPGNHATLLRSKLGSQNYTNSHMTSEYRKRAQVLHQLLSRTYFKRAWIVQELIFSREINFQCGTETVSWETLMSTLNEISKYDPLDVRGTECPTRAYTDEKTILRDNPALKWLELFEGYRRAFRTNTMQNELICLINIFASTEQSLPHDRVYALLELEKRKHLERPLQPDYRLNLGQVFVQVLRDRTCSRPSALSSIALVGLPKPWFWNLNPRGDLAAVLESDHR